LGGLERQGRNDAPTVQKEIERFDAARTLRAYFSPSMTVPPRMTMSCMGPLLRLTIKQLTYLPLMLAALMIGHHFDLSFRSPPPRALERRSGLMVIACSREWEQWPKSFP
jgi:hypothetical protein